MGVNKNIVAISTADPPAVANAVVEYAKLILGVSERFIRKSDGTILQLGLEAAPVVQTVIENPVDTVVSPLNDVVFMTRGDDDPTRGTLADGTVDGHRIDVVITDGLAAADSVRIQTSSAFITADGTASPSDPWNYSLTLVWNASPLNGSPRWEVTNRLNWLVT